MTLKVGDVAPDFTLLSDQEQPVTLSQLRGKKVVLYFYPKDDTPGCTKEACDFRDNLARLTSAKAVVLGISKDTPSKHQKFKEKYQLPFTLLADTDGTVCTDYDIFKKKSMFGKSFLGIQRTTFLIDEQGVIQAIWRNVKVSGHVEQVINAIK